MASSDVARALRVGRDAWPALHVSDEAFEAMLTRVCPSSEVWPSLNLADLYLACACADGDALAIEELEARYVTRVGSYLERTERDPAVVDEVRQMVRAHLLLTEGGRRPRIGEYGGRGSLASFLRVVTVRLHATLRRSGARETLREAPAPLATASPELLLLRARYLPAMESSLRHALASLVGRERTILRMHFVDGLSLERIGRIYGVNKGTVSRWIASVRDRLHAAAAAQLRAEAGDAAEDIESLLGLVASELNLSISRLLGDAPTTSA